MRHVLFFFSIPRTFLLGGFVIHFELMFSIHIGLIQHSDMAGREVWPKLIYYADDSRICPSLSAITYCLMSWSSRLLVSGVLIFWCPDVNHQLRTGLGDMLGKLINHSDQSRPCPASDHISPDVLIAWILVVRLGGTKKYQVSKFNGCPI